MRSSTYITILERIWYPSSEPRSWISGKKKIRCRPSLKFTKWISGGIIRNKKVLAPSNLNFFEHFYRIIYGDSSIAIFLLFVCILKYLGKIPYQLVFFQINNQIKKFIHQKLSFINFGALPKDFKSEFLIKFCETKKFWSFHLSFQFRLFEKFNKMRPQQSYYLLPFVNFQENRYHELWYCQRIYYKDFL